MTVVEGPPAIYTLRGEQFSISAPSWQCPDTGERYTTPDQDVEFITRLHRAWRERHGVSKELVRQSRKALGLSRAQAADQVGLRPGRYRRYEKTDRLPSRADAKLLSQLVATRQQAIHQLGTLFATEAITHLIKQASATASGQSASADNLGILLRKALAPARPPEQAPDIYSEEAGAYQLAQLSAAARFA